MKIWGLCLVLVAGLVVSRAGLALESYAEGTYSVPTIDLELLPYHQYAISQVWVEISGENLKLAYNFPKALTGTDFLIEMAGKVNSDGVWELKSDYAGTLSCPLVDGFRVCLSSYPKLSIDPSSRIAYLKQNYTGKELEARMKLGRIFNGEPEPEIQMLFRGSDGERIGVLRFKAP